MNMDLVARGLKLLWRIATPAQAKKIVSSLPIKAGAPEEVAGYVEGLYMLGDLPDPTAALQKSGLLLPPDLLKGRPRGGSYLVAYMVTTHGGSQYERRIYTAEEQQKFLASVQQGRYAAVVQVGQNNLPPAAPGVDPHEVANKRAQGHTNKKQFRHLGQMINVPAHVALTMDHLPGLYERLESIKAKRDSFRATENSERAKGNTAAADEAKAKADLYDRLFKRHGVKVEQLHLDVLTNPARVKLLQINTVVENLKATRAQGRMELEAHPSLLSEWEAHNKAEEKAAKKEKRAPVLRPKPLGLPTTEEEINRLMGRLHFLRGKKTDTRVHKERVSDERGVTLIAPVADIGVDPDRNPVSYALSLGEWAHKDKKGFNAFGKREVQALYEEFHLPIRSILFGSTFKEGHAPGWLRAINGADQFKEDLLQEAHLIVLDRARRYTSAFAKEKLAKEGVNFRQHVVSWLKFALRKKLRELAIEAGNTDMLDEIDNTENEADPLKMAPGYTGDAMSVGGNNLRPVRHLSGEEVTIIHDAMRVIGETLTDLDATVLFSRLNLHNSTTHHHTVGKKGEATLIGGLKFEPGDLKPWDVVGDDLVGFYPQASTEARERIAKRSWTSALVRLRAQAEEGGMSKENSEAIRAGLRLMIAVMIHKTRSMPTTEGWRRNEAGDRSEPKEALHDVLRKLNPRKEADRQIRDLVIAADSQRRYAGDLVIAEQALGQKTLREARNEGHLQPEHVLNIKAHPDSAAKFWNARPELKDAFGLKTDYAHVHSQANIALPTAHRQEQVLTNTYHRAWRKLESMSEAKLKGIQHSIAANGKSPFEFVSPDHTKVMIDHILADKKPKPKPPPLIRKSLGETVPLTVLIDAVRLLHDHLERTTSRKKAKKSFDGDLLVEARLGQQSNAKLFLDPNASAHGTGFWTGKYKPGQDAGDEDADELVSEAAKVVVASYFPEEPEEERTIKALPLVLPKGR